MIGITNSYSLLGRDKCSFGINANRGIGVRTKDLVPIFATFHEQGNLQPLVEDFMIRLLC